VVVIQAALFGAMHYPKGAIPNGFVGLGLTFVYGIALGVVRYRSEGLLAPWIAHTITDIAVFAVVASALLF
jgi:membrane protease YdiL (CAAX protease family)